MEAPALLQLPPLLNVPEHFENIVDPSPIEVAEIQFLYRKSEFPEYLHLGPELLALVTVDIEQNVVDAKL